jgi:hypothetical protein
MILQGFVTKQPPLSPCWAHICAHIWAHMGPTNWAPYLFHPTVPYYIPLKETIRNPWAQTWAHHGPTMHPKWTQNRPQTQPKMVPTFTQIDPNGPKIGPNWAPREPKGPNMDPKCAHKGPYGLCMGPEMSVEQTLIADSPRAALMTKTNHIQTTETHIQQYQRNHRYETHFPNSTIPM